MIDHVKFKRALLISALLVANTVFHPVVSSAGPDADEIREKMTEIVFLREKVKQNKSLAVKILVKLKDQKSRLSEEVKAEHSRLGRISFEEGIQTPRIFYNLKLMGKIDLYISRLDEKITLFEEGQEELSFIYREADDLLKIVEAVKDIELDQLMSQMDHILKKQRGAGNRACLDFILDEQGPDRKIWTEIFDG
ncbi:MAG: hypothetical protein V2J25_01285 [Desulfatiglans sp.]|jgi:hypothetical protein|nr:hypothetical protein [Thermodesulfobacteriota bacterium]MEE4351479.1 hypothetical protein [Desulfatiglans sp.]